MDKDVIDDLQQLSNSKDIVSSLMHALIAMSFVLISVCLIFLVSSAAGITFNINITSFTMAGLISGFYIGRENAQREYKLGGAKKIKFYEGFTGWSQDNIYDAIFPLCSSNITAYLLIKVW